MIAIEFASTALPADEDVKKRAAVKQMNELVERLSAAPKYHTLTVKDRQTLISEGYARDLIDNLIFTTQRTLKQLKSYDQPPVSLDSNDHLTIGFTYAAFDPALFASNTITTHLKKLSNGCCAFCESFLAPTDSGEIGHFRPVQLIDNASIDKHVLTSTCSPYYALAYKQDNLLYVCKGCNEYHKVGLFPVVGARFPKITIEDEQALLVNPYIDDPRQYIRFDPLTGRAYAYDKVVAFLIATQQLSASEAEQLIWSQPSMISKHTTSNDDNAFTSWFLALPNDEQINLSRGEVSIEIFGLNRPALLLARLAHSQQLQAMYTHIKDSLSARPSANNAESKNTESSSQTSILKDVPTHAYRSFAIDVFNSWQYKRNHKNKSQTDTLKQHQENTEIPTITHADDSALAAIRSFPMWFRSCINYCVGESRLGEQNKRQLVLLSRQDAHYGQKSIEKSVFLGIDWLADQHKVIKVKSSRNIWETSFLELAHSRPQELSNLFSHNEVWVEGPFTSLSKT
ncbi:hypothetical protein [Pseudoalteromonas aliena]|uniref:hypothetical protein n=1 Tax=Pseudoalteromonas aliena TaxID=247523 RepID=UPI002493DB45|nr:hypothetical protein [Pseudoalteromonas aliena]